MTVEDHHYVCYVVPPYLLNAIADSSNNDTPVRESARQALTLHKSYIDKREKRFAALCAPRGLKGATNVHQKQGIVPDHMLQYITECEDVDEDTRACAKRDLEHIKSVHAKYQEVQGLQAQSLEHQAAVSSKQPPKTVEKTYRAVYDAQHDSNEAHLPGKVVRVEGQKATKDESVNEAYDNAGLVLAFYKDIFNWNSIDNKNMHVISSVHFAKNYENAFWDPEAAQMVYGDGHNFLTNFTGCIDVIGHELTHAVTEYTSPLDYTGQSGALNEHVSDVFGIMIKQRVEDETADKADWLIGEDCLMPGVKGVALRSMKAPGTAYDDPRFGKDPQPENFKDYVKTVEDNGGVHLFSGIPNKAFYNASVAFGGYSWEKAGKIWWETMHSGQVPPRCTFIQFADVTVEKAEELFGDDAAAIVRKAWNDVGVVRKSHG
ncbi:Metalloprotease [Hypomontagnella monticulosa]|nr:Metalloprotease [Hypomontagnella monticulosa]